MSLYTETPHVYDSSYRGQPECSMSYKQKTCFVLTVTVTLIIISVMAIYSLIVTSKDNKFHVNNVTLTQFTLSSTNDTLYYNVMFNMTFRNPSPRVGVHYDDSVKAKLMYHGQMLAFTEVQGFYLGHKKENDNVAVVFKGQHLLQLFRGDEKVLYESESKDGIYNLGLKLKLNMRPTVFWDDNYKSIVICDNLKVPLSNSQAKIISSENFERIKCSFKQIDFYYPEYNF